MNDESVTAVMRLAEKLRRSEPVPASDYRRLATAAKRTALEDTLAAHIAAYGLPEPEREYRFHPTRKWPFDFAWPGLMIAAEVNGGTWIKGGGRHNRGSKMDDEYEKLNAAALLGWRVFLFTGDMVRDGRAVAVLAEALA